MSSLRLMGKWGVPVATAVAVPIFGPSVFADTGSKDSAKTMSGTSRMIRPSELPIYEEPEEVLDFEYHGRERTSLEETVGAVRGEIEGVFEATRSTRERVVHICETGKAHTMASVDMIKNLQLLQVTIDYISDEENMLPRVGAITIGGLAGLVLGARKKGGLAKKAFYTSAGITATASMCYPRQAYQISQQAYGTAKEYANIGYNFVAGVKPQSKVAVHEEPKKEPAVEPVPVAEPSPSPETPPAETASTESEGGEVRSVLPQAIPDEKFPAPVDSLVQQASDVMQWGFRLTDKESNAPSIIPAGVVPPTESLVPEGFGSVSEADNKDIVESATEQVTVPKESGSQTEETEVPDTMEEIVEKIVDDIAEKVGEDIVEDVAVIVKEVAEETLESIEEVAKVADFVENITESVSSTIDVIQEVLESADKAAEEAGLPDTLIDVTEAIVEGVERVVDTVNVIAGKVEDVAEAVVKEVKDLKDDAIELVESEEKREELVDKIIDYVKSPDDEIQKPEEAKEPIAEESKQLIDEKTTEGEGLDAKVSELEGKASLPDQVEVVTEPAPCITEPVAEVTELTVEPEKKPTDESLVEQKTSVSKEDNVQVAVAKQGLFSNILSLFTKDKEEKVIKETPDVCEETAESTDKGSTTGLSEEPTQLEPENTVAPELLPMVEKLAENIVEKAGERVVEEIAEVVEEISKEAEKAAEVIAETAEVVDESGEEAAKCVKAIEVIAEAADEAAKDVPGVPEIVEEISEKIDEIAKESEAVIDTVVAVAEKVEEMAKEIDQEAKIIEAEAAILVESEEKREELVEKVIEFVGEKLSGDSPKEEASSEVLEAKFESQTVKVDESIEPSQLVAENLEAAAADVKKEGLFDKLVNLFKDKDAKMEEPESHIVEDVKELVDGAEQILKPLDDDSGKKPTEEEILKSDEVLDQKPTEEVEEQKPAEEQNTQEVPVSDTVLSKDGGLVGKLIDFFSNDEKSSHAEQVSGKEEEISNTELVTEPVGVVEVPVEATPEVPLDTTPEVVVETTPALLGATTIEVPVERTPEVSVDTPELPVETTPELPVETTPELPVETTPELPVETTPELPVETTPELPVETTPELPVETTPELPEVSVGKESQLGTTVQENSIEAEPEVLPVEKTEDSVVETGTETKSNDGGLIGKLIDFFANDDKTSHSEQVSSKDETSQSELVNEPIGIAEVPLDTAPEAIVETKSEISVEGTPELPLETAPDSTVDTVSEVPIEKESVSEAPVETTVQEPSIQAEEEVLPVEKTDNSVVETATETKNKEGGLVGKLIGFFANDEKTSHAEQVLSKEEESSQLELVTTDTTPGVSLDSTPEAIVETTPDTPVETTPDSPVDVAHEIPTDTVSEVSIEKESSLEAPVETKIQEPSIQAEPVVVPLEQKEDSVVETDDSGKKPTEEEILKSDEVLDQKPTEEVEEQKPAEEQNTQEVPVSDTVLSKDGGLVGKLINFFSNDEKSSHAEQVSGKEEEISNTELVTEPVGVVEVPVEATPEVPLDTTPEVVVETTPELLGATTIEVPVERTPEVSVATPELPVEITSELPVEKTEDSIVETATETKSKEGGLVGKLIGFFANDDKTSHTEQVLGKEEETSQLELVTTDTTPGVSLDSTPEAIVETTPDTPVETTPDSPVDVAHEIPTDTVSEVSIEKESSLETPVETKIQEPSIQAEPEVVPLEHKEDSVVETATETKSKEGGLVGKLIDFFANDDKTSHTEQVSSKDKETSQAELVTEPVSVEEVSVGTIPEVNVEITAEVPVETTSELPVETSPEVLVETTAEVPVETEVKEVKEGLVDKLVNLFSSDKASHTSAETVTDHLVKEEQPLIVPEALEPASEAVVTEEKSAVPEETIAQGLEEGPSVEAEEPIPQIESVESKENADGGLVGKLVSLFSKKEENLKVAEIEIVETLGKVSDDKVTDESDFVIVEHSDVSEAKDIAADSLNVTTEIVDKSSDIAESEVVLASDDSGKTEGLFDRLRNFMSTSEMKEDPKLSDVDETLVSDDKQEVEPEVAELPSDVKVEAKDIITSTATEEASSVSKEGSGGLFSSFGTFFTKEKSEVVESVDDSPPSGELDNKGVEENTQSENVISEPETPTLEVKDKSLFDKIAELISANDDKPEGTSDEALGSITQESQTEPSQEELPQQAPEVDADQQKPLLESSYAETKPSLLDRVTSLFSNESENVPTDKQSAVNEESNESSSSPDSKTPTSDEDADVFVVLSKPSIPVETPAPEDGQKEAEKATGWLQGSWFRSSTSVSEEGKDIIIQVAPETPEKDYGQSNPEDEDMYTTRK
ncbi:fap1 adhesin-like isoform X2 [Palaemon carinicauda]|uniref:fap1 adhesin-like isoform X2 n=1 Tax=Palaemon carinicauda TaxID=392227 RepID=UPI0035B6A69D